VVRQTLEPTSTNAVCAGNAAAAAGAIIYLFLYLPYYFIIPHYDDLDYLVMMVVGSIDHVVTMSFGCVQIAAFEHLGKLIKQLLTDFSRPR